MNFKLLLASLAVVHLCECSNELESNRKSDNSHLEVQSSDLKISHETIEQLEIQLMEGIKLGLKNSPENKREYLKMMSDSEIEVYRELWSNVIDVWFTRNPGKEEEIRSYLAKKVKRDFLRQSSSQDNIFSKSESESASQLMEFLLKESDQIIKEYLTKVCSLFSGDIDFDPLLEHYVDKFKKRNFFTLLDDGTSMSSEIIFPLKLESIRNSELKDVLLDKDFLLFMISSDIIAYSYILKFIENYDEKIAFDLKDIMENLITKLSHAGALIFKKTDDEIGQKGFPKYFDSLLRCVYDLTLETLPDDFYSAAGSSSGASSSRSLSSIQKIGGRVYGFAATDSSSDGSRNLSLVSKKPKILHGYSSAFGEIGRPDITCDNKPSFMGGSGILSDRPKESFGTVSVASSGSSCNETLDPEQIRMERIKRFKESGGI